MWSLPSSTVVKEAVCSPEGWALSEGAVLPEGAGEPVSPPVVVVPQPESRERLMPAARANARIFFQVFIFILSLKSFGIFD